MAEELCSLEIDAVDECVDESVGGSVGEGVGEGGHVNEAVVGDVGGRVGDKRKMMMDSNTLSVSLYTSDHLKNIVDVDYSGNDFGNRPNHSSLIF